ncbi:MAG TPA: glucose dehydrogenase, partial [Pirellulales bacterium]
MIEPASDEGQRAIATFTVPDGMKVELVAAEPDLANPVSFCFDERGRIYVTESFRIKHGVEDNRAHMDWLDEDLAAKTIGDRLAYEKKHLGDRIGDYVERSDRIKLLEDRDGDGRVDHSSIFADGFNDILDGNGAGVLANHGDVYYTCIPHLWKLSGESSDGRATKRESLSEGYGVKTTLMGHDMHGLIVGPDGKLYFSIGDRGLNVEVP